MKNFPDCFKIFVYLFIFKFLGRIRSRKDHCEVEYFVFFFEAGTTFSMKF